MPNNDRGKKLKVARVVNLTLVFTGYFLWFCDNNQVMQNTIPKLRQSCIISKETGLFVWKVENFEELQLS